MFANSSTSFMGTNSNIGQLPGITLKNSPSTTEFFNDLGSVRSSIAIK